MDARHRDHTMPCAQSTTAPSTRRLASLSRAVLTPRQVAAVPLAPSASPFHWIGEPSLIADSLSPPPDHPVFAAGGFTQVTANAREFRDSLLLTDGSSPELYHSGLQHQGIHRRFADRADESLPPHPEPVGVVPHLRSWVETMEQLSLEEMPTAATMMTSPEQGAAPDELIAAAVIAASRSCELVADHHGGPLHVTAGAWSVLLVAQHLRKRSPEWAQLALVQGLTNTNRHIQVGAKLGGPVQMPLLEAMDGFEEVSWSNPNALADALGYLGEAVRMQRPIEGERALLAALAAGANAGQILATLLDHALPRNCQDDHYFLYPIFAMWTLELIGWRYAAVALRPVVRYLATTPAAGSADPAGFSEAFRTGRAKDDASWGHILSPDAALPPGGSEEICAQLAKAAEEFAPAEDAEKKTGFEPASGDRGSAGPPPPRMVEAVAEWEHVRTEGKPWSALGAAAPPVGGLRRNGPEEVAASLALGERLSDTAAHGHDRVAVYKAVPVAMAAALTSGLSVEAALDGLSLGAARLYLRSEIGNPVDVHLVTGIGARRYLLEQSEVAASTVAFSLLLWASGFEVTQLHSRGVEQVSYFENDSFGAGPIPTRGAALGQTEALATLTAEELLVGPIALMLGPDRSEKHATGVGSLLPLVGGSSVVTLNAGAEVAERLWPLIWLFAERGGTSDLFFDYVFRFVAVDDFTEMHLFKLAACCKRECEVMDRQHHWLFMCCTAKSVCNSAGAGRRVFEIAGPLLGLPPTVV